MLPLRLQHPWRLRPPALSRQARELSFRLRPVAWRTLLDTAKIEHGSADYLRLTWPMAVGSFLIFANLYVFQPILPTLARELSLSATQVNCVFAASTLTLALSLVVWAVVSDAHGRRRVLLLGLYLAVLIHVGLLLFPSFAALIIARALMGIALGAFAAIAMAHMAEELSERAFAMAAGSYIAANSLGGICGRIVGGVVTDAFDWQTAVLLLTIATALGALLLSRILPTERHFTPKRLSPMEVISELGDHVKNHVVWFAMLIGGLNFALFVNLFSVIGFRLTSAPFDLPVSAAALIFLCYLPGTISARYSARWVSRKGPMRAIQWGCAVSILGLWLASIDSVTTILISLLLISGGAFFVHALAFGWVSLKARKGKATAGALYLVHYYAGGSLGGFVLLACWEFGQWPAVIACSMAIYGLLITLSMLIDRRPR